MAIKKLGVFKVKRMQDNASMRSVVFLRTDVPKISFSGWSWREHGRSLGLLLAGMLAISAIAFTASGSSFDYYPDICLGSWTNPQNAQGRPLPITLRDSKRFTPQNSAVFVGGTQSVICQAFAGEPIPDDATLSSLNLTLSLVVKHPLVPTVVEPLVPEVPGAPVEEPTSVGSDESEFIIIDGPTGEPEGGEPVEGEPTAETPAEETEEGSEPAQEPESQPEPAPEPSAPAEPSSDSSTGSGPSAFNFALINSARAQEASEGLVTISYSLDGIDWQALGRVADAPVQDLSFQIPIGAGGVTAVADIANLRVRFDGSFLDIDATEVYLDGMRVEINTDEYVSEEPLPLDEIQTVEGLPGFSQAITQTFSLARNVIPTEEVLSWQPLDYQLKNEAKSDDITRSVATGDAQTGGIKVSGSCQKDYFTVLVFRNQDDYANAPRTALFNSAFPCDNGLYSYSLLPASLRLKAGTYYLLVAEQPGDGPWIPISALMPFTVE